MLARSAQSTEQPENDSDGNGERDCQWPKRGIGDDPTRAEARALGRRSEMDDPAMVRNTLICSPECRAGSTPLLVIVHIAARCAYWLSVA